MIIEPAALRSLEIEKVLNIIRKDCRSDLGAAVLKKIIPSTDLDALKKRHSLFVSIEERRDTVGELPWNYHLSAVGHLLEDAKSSGMLLGEELLIVRNLLIGAAKMRAALVEGRAQWPDFNALIKDIRDFEPEIKLLSVIDDDGRLYDHASDRLRRLREQLKKIRDNIRRKGQHVIGDQSLSGMLQERVLSLRNGRYVVLVRQDALSSFPGLVMDRSGSGNSVYMEPHVLIPLNNEHTVAQEDENAEERRILHKLTEKMLERETPILDAEDVLGRVDLFYALSEKIRRDKWHLPQLEEKPILDFKRARHPLLGDAAVPIDIECGERFQILVVTGPNTGGKTVALKTAGVCAILGWLGFPIPAEENSRLGVIEAIYADIGDEQSIEQNLSTFSAHVTHITAVLAAAGRGSLVLLDELGAGTDPDEGAALGIALLDWLLRQKSLVLATTHHNPIKRFALVTEGIESASVEFNANTLSPTYKLLIGIPGRSNALLIASKLGMPKAILDRAREALYGKETSMEDIIGELQEKRTAIEEESRSLDETKREVEALREEYEAKRKELIERRDKMIAEADKEALDILESAQASAKSLLKNMDAAAESAARRSLEESRRDYAERKDEAQKRTDERITRAHAPDATPLEPGDTVLIIDAGVSGVIEKIRGDKAIIQTAIARTEVQLKHLRRTSKPQQKDKTPQVKVNTPSAPTGVPSSIMIRGMTLDEAIPMAELYLDRAFRAGYGEVSIIHGRGEGILRREIQQLCARIPYIQEYRLGGHGEGGHGVTVVKFKRG